MVREVCSLSWPGWRLGNLEMSRFFLPAKMGVDNYDGGLSSW